MTVVRRALAPTTVLFGGLLAASGANFGFHLIAGRLLPVDQYGLLNAIVSLISVIALPAAAVEVSIVRHVGSSRHDMPAPVGAWIGRAAAVGGVAGLAVVLGGSPLRRLLAFDDPAIVWLLAAYLPVMLASVVLRGVCLGRLRYHRAGAVVVTGAAVRLVSVVAGASLLGAAGALLAVVAAEMVTAAGFLLATHGDVSWRGDGSPIPLRAAALSLLALAGFWALVSLDVVAARILLPAEQAGGYAAISIIAKAALFAPQAVVSVMYPRFVAQPNDRLRLLGRAVASAGVLGGAASLALLLRPVYVLSVLFGGRFISQATLLGPLATVAAGLGIASVLLHYHLAAASRRSLAPWAGVAAAIVMVTAGMRSSEWIAASVGVGMLVTVLMLSAGVGSRRGGGRGVIPSRLTDEPALDLTVVVPFYNPGRAVGDTVGKVIAELRAADLTFEVIAVSDGCTDDSVGCLQQLRDPSLSFIALPHNQGKGAALRVGLERGRGRYLGFIDADGDIDPQLWRPFLSLMRLYEPDIVLGSKRHPLSDVEYPPVRRLLSWGYQQLTRLLFRLNIRDTQTGIKLVRREVLAAVLPRLVERRFSFDVELLAVARRLGYTRLFEAPIRLRHQRFNSTVSWHAVRRMAIDTVLVFVRLQLLRQYDTPRTTTPAHATVATNSTVEAAA